MSNPLDGWQVDRASIRYVGHDLERPECILAERDGTLWSADGRGGVVRIAADGSQELILQSTVAPSGPSSFEDRYVNTRGSLPNGLAFDADGNFLIANFGTDSLELMTRDGRRARWSIASRASRSARPTSSPATAGPAVADGHHADGAVDPARRDDEP